MNPGSSPVSGVPFRKESTVDVERLAQLELLADRFYNSADAGERRQAQASLLPFTTNSECISQCQFLLNNSQKPYALLLASSSLLKLLTQFWNLFSQEQTTEMRNYLLNYLAANCEKGLPNFVATAVVQVVCRVIKLSWLTSSANDSCNEIAKFLEHSVSHRCLGLQLLAELVDQMNHPIPGETISSHRKIAVSFRDKALLDVFQLGLASLDRIQSISKSSGGIPSDALHQKWKLLSLRLVLMCLSFDYIGTCSDESTEEFGSLQIPSTWRSRIEDAAALRMFFEILHSSQSGELGMCMEIIVQLASCRRSLFSTEDLRKEYLRYLLIATSDIIDHHSQLLSDKECYTHFCRLLVAMKANCQLQDLVKIEEYSPWIRSVSAFTIKSFENWEWTGTSAHYLVTLWARLTLSIPYMRGDLPTYLEQLLPHITQVFINSRSKTLANAIKDGDAQTFFEESSMSENLHYMPTLCRHVYGACYDFLIARIDPLLTEYRDAVVRNQFNNNLQLIEGDLAWMIYVIGSIISGFITTSTCRDDQITMDAHLSARIFSIVDVVTVRVANSTRINADVHPYIDVAMLYFFQQFRKSYIGQEASSRSLRILDPIGQASNNPQIFQSLSDFIGVQTDQATIVTVMIQKLLSNLKYWATDSSVVDLCLTLLHDLSTGYSSSKLLLNLEIIQTILTKHGQSDVFPFLDVACNSKLRSKFYLTWGRLVCYEPHIDYFEQFMERFDERFAFLSRHSDFRSQQVRTLGVGLARDLRGIVQSTYTKTTYSIFFDWIYPKYFGQVLRLLESLWDTPICAVPLLRFAAEFVLNRTQRIAFSPSSPNGIILFKEAAKVIAMYGCRVLACSDPVGDLYKERYKGIGLCMDIFYNGLSGDYTNFGVFALYNDASLSGAFQTIIKLVLMFPLPELLAFSKISTKYFTLLEILFRNHVELLVELDSNVFLSILSSLADGISSFDVRQSSLAATAIDNVASFVFSETKKKVRTETFAKFEKHLSESRMEIFPQFLQLLLGLVLFENASNHWSLSRPVLTLILTMEPHFNQYKTDLIRCQASPETQAMVSKAFERLMDGVRPSIDNRNRDKFTQNLILFRADMRKWAIRPAVIN